MIRGGGSRTEAESVTVTVGEVVLNDIGLKDFGFDVVSGSTTSVTSSKRLNVDDGSIEKSVIDNNCFTITSTVDTRVMSKASFSDEAYLTISFTYIGYTSKQNNIISSLVLYPENYTGYSFSAQKSSKTTQNKNGTTTTFSFPLKTKNDISLSTVALLDSTYPRTDDHSGTVYKVPVVFKFEIDEDTLNTDILSSNPKYNVTFGLSTTAV